MKIVALFLIFVGFSVTMAAARHHHRLPNDGGILAPDGSVEKGTFVLKRSRFLFRNFSII